MPRPVNIVYVKSCMATDARRARLAAVAVALATTAAFGACDGGETFGPPPSGTSTSSGGSGGDDFLPPDDGGPPDLDAAGLCGNQLHETIANAPNVYFVIDSSGSMSVTVGGKTRYALVRNAVLDLARSLGALINVGAALFPGDDECMPGAEVMPVTPGDPYTGSDGPTIKTLKSATNVSPKGGTPTSKTLKKLLPNIAALPGKSFVVLVTDGGPNCNAAASCSASGCMPNIEGCSGDSCCDPGGNCCAPNAPAGPESCVDTEVSVEAVTTFQEAGIPVYVVGIAGSELYADVLKDMAVAAGTSQLAPPYYFAVENLDNLGAVLGSIASIAVSCIFNVEDPPAEPDQTNVYLDGVVLPGDLQNGWRWMDPDLTRIELLGDACQRLKTGKVKLVQIVSGCPTEPPK